MKINIINKKRQVSKWTKVSIKIAACRLNYSKFMWLAKIALYPVVVEEKSFKKTLVNKDIE